MGARSQREIVALDSALQSANSRARRARNEALQEGVMSERARLAELFEVTVGDIALLGATGEDGIPTDDAKQSLERVFQSVAALALSGDVDG